MNKNTKIYAIIFAVIFCIAGNNAFSQLNLTGNNPKRSFHPMIFAPDGCSTKIKSGSNLRFISASYIELQSGFEVEIGASFEADVYECNMINH